MTWVVFVGGLVVSFAPAVAVFVGLVIRDPQLIILTIGGAFVWLVGVLFSSMMWYLLPGKDVYWASIIYAVMFQELVRLGFCLLYMLIERRLERMGLSKEFPNRLLVSVALGLGSGVVYVLVTYVTILWESIGPGALFCDSCSRVSLFMINGAIAAAFLILHILLSLIAFEAYCRRKWLFVAAVWISHYAASFSTLLNGTNGSCIAAVLVVYSIDVIVCGLAVLVLRSSPLLIKYPRQSHNDQ
ncbi:gamma-secretase subunit Aph-1 [Pelomyxa schiedti]|nr:gamma-secretase subunit Aph-1 [Pelomyxa schiedti]